MTGSAPHTEPDPAPEALAGRYGESLRSENTFDVETELLASVRARAGRGWGVGTFTLHNGRLLFVRHGQQWFLPGGMLEGDETPAAGAIRETREETGIEVNIDGLAAIAEQTFSDGRESFVFHFAVFDATPETTALAADPGLDGEAIHEIEWHDALPENTYDPGLYARLLARNMN